MNRFITENTGGQPIYTSDFAFIDTAVRNTINSLAKGFAEIGEKQSFIISGCAWTPISGSAATMGAGFIFLDGEILRVETHNYSTYGSEYFQKVVTPINSIGFADGNNHNTWELQKAAITSGASTTLRYNGVRLKEMVSPTAYYNATGIGSWHFAKTSGTLGNLINDGNPYDIDLYSYNTVFPRMINANPTFVILKVKLRAENTAFQLRLGVGLSALSRSAVELGIVGIGGIEYHQVLVPLYYGRFRYKIYGTLDTDDQVGIEVLGWH